LLNVAPKLLAAAEPIPVSACLVIANKLAMAGSTDQKIQCHRSMLDLDVGTNLSTA
jgi:hypothetical protein